MEPTFYSSMVQSAWRTAFRERRLWAFALLAGLVIGSGIGSALIQLYGADITEGWWGYGGGVAGNFGALWAQAWATGGGAVAALLALGVLVLASIAVVIWAIVVSTAAILLGTEATARGERASSGIGRRAIAFVGRVFLILLAVRIASLLIVAIWHALLLWQALTPTTLTIAAGIVAFVVLAVVLSIVHIITPFAIMGVVLDRMQPVQAIRESVALVRDRWLIVIETSVVLTAVNIVGVLAWMVGSFILALPFAFLVGIGSTRGMSWLTMTSFTLGGITLLIFTAIVAMVITTFLVAAWTTLYLRLTGPGEPPEPWLRHFGRS